MTGPALTTPTGAPQYIVGVNPDALTQAQRRKDRNARDQHGRIWLIILEETRTPRGRELDMCGGPPDSVGFSDPLGTPSKYFRMGRDEFGEVLPNKLTIDYDQWIEEAENGDRDWHNFFWAIAALKFPGGIEAEAALRHPWLLQLAGPRPWPRPSLIRLARDGHAGFLGTRPLTPEESALLGKQLKVDDLLAELRGQDNPTLTGHGVPVTVASVTATTDHQLATAPIREDEVFTYRDFVREGRKQGLPITEIADRWAKHKAALGV